MGYTMRDINGHELAVGMEVIILEDRPSSSFFMKNDVMRVSAIDSDSYNTHRLHGYLIGGPLYPGYDEVNRTNYIRGNACVIRDKGIVTKRKQLRSWVMQ